MKNSEDDLATKYPDVLDKVLGRLPRNVYLQVDPASQPVILPVRKMPVSVREKFKAELQRFQDRKVIAPVINPLIGSVHSWSQSRSLVSYASALIRSHSVLLLKKRKVPDSCY